MEINHLFSGDEVVSVFSFKDKTDMVRLLNIDRLKETNKIIAEGEKIIVLKTTAKELIFLNIVIGGLMNDNDSFELFPFEQSKFIKMTKNEEG